MTYGIGWNTYNEERERIFFHFIYLWDFKGITNNAHFKIEWGFVAMIISGHCTADIQPQVTWNWEIQSTLIAHKILSCSRTSWTSAKVNPENTYVCVLGLFLQPPSDTFHMRISTNLKVIYVNHKTRIFFIKRKFDFFISSNNIFLSFGFSFISIFVRFYGFLSCSAQLIAVEAGRSVDVERRERV